MHYEYWTEEDVAIAACATSFGGLRLVAERVLTRMPPRAGMVCGPISTGGLGSVEKNLTRFAEHIRHLVERGEVVFNQTPFEEAMARLRQLPGNTPQVLLDTFYLPLFEEGRLVRFWFIPGWQSSYGARWERAQAERLGITVEDLPEDFSF